MELVGPTLGLLTAGNPMYSVLCLFGQRERTDHTHVYCLPGETRSLGSFM
jgi:hypothetical protein